MYGNMDTKTLATLSEVRKKIAEDSSRITVEAANEIYAKMQDVIDTAIGKAYNQGVDVHYSDATLIKTIAANVDNDKLSDADFRQFIRNSLK